MKVTLLTATPEPLRTIAAGVKNMRGEMVHDLFDISEEEADLIFTEMSKTALNGVFEWVNMVFQIEGVSRAFTHQLVRHRVGYSFSQESMRFTKVEDMAVLKGPSVKTEAQMQTWANVLDSVESGYQRLLDLGVDIQDARGLLPTNVLTKIGMGVTYRALVKLAGDRLCLQAQGEWRSVMAAIKAEVSAYEPRLAELLKPVCKHTGKCEFKSIFDRECPLDPARQS